MQVAASQDTNATPSLAELLRSEVYNKFGNRWPYGYEGGFRCLAIHMAGRLGVSVPDVMRQFESDGVLVETQVGADSRRPVKSWRVKLAS